MNSVDRSVNEIQRIQNRVVREMEQGHRTREEATEINVLLGRARLLIERPSPHPTPH